MCAFVRRPTSKRARARMCASRRSLLVNHAMDPRGQRTKEDAAGTPVACRLFRFCDGDITRGRRREQKKERKGGMVVAEKSKHPNKEEDPDCRHFFKGRWKGTTKSQRPYREWPSLRCPDPRRDGGKKTGGRPKSVCAPSCVPRQCGPHLFSACVADKNRKPGGMSTACGQTSSRSAKARCCGARHRPFFRNKSPLSSHRNAGATGKKCGTKGEESQAKKRAHIRGLGQKRRKRTTHRKYRHTSATRHLRGAAVVFSCGHQTRALWPFVRRPCPRAVFRRPRGLSFFFGRGFRTASRNRPAGGPRPMMSASRRSTHSQHHRNDHTEPPVCPFDLFRENPRVFLAPSCGAPSIAPVPRKAKGTTSTQPAGQDPVPSSSITFGDRFRRPLSCAPPRCSPHIVPSSTGQTQQKYEGQGRKETSDDFKETAATASFTRARGTERQQQGNGSTAATQ